MSSAGGAKDLRRAFENELLGQLWEGKVNVAIELLKGALEWVRNPAAVEELIAYLEKRRAYIPNYGSVQVHCNSDVSRRGGAGVKDAARRGAG